MTGRSCCTTRCRFRPARAPPRSRPAKTRLAASRMEEALALIVAGDPGEPQRGEATTFTSAQRAAIRRVGDPSSLTWDELERRLRAFELIELELAGSMWEVTALRRIDDARAERGLEFTTADGVRAAPHRFVHLPLAVVPRLPPAPPPRSLRLPSAGGRMFFANWSVKVRTNPDHFSEGHDARPPGAAGRSIVSREPR